MVSDFLTFTWLVVSGVFGWLAIVTGALRYWAEVTNDPRRTFLGKPKLWRWLTVGFLFVSCFQVWRAAHLEAREIGPSYALVGRDGSLLAQKNFSQYGLAVEVLTEQTPAGKFTTYRLRFKAEPEHIEVTTTEGAIPSYGRTGPGEWDVAFITAGWDRQPIAAEFKVKAK
jgi:hypothetical protein